MKFHHLNLNEKPNLGEDISILIEYVLNLQEDDKKYLTRLSITLSEIEPKINFAQIFKTVFFSKASLPNFSAAKNRKEDIFSYCKVISRIIQRLTISNNYNWTEDQLFSCAIDIFYRCMDWSMADMVFFIYHVRTNPYNRPEFKKNTITPTDLLNLIPVYNELRAIEHERLIRIIEQEKGNSQETTIIIKPKLPLK